MNILVTVASKHGATAQLGERIASVLADEGLNVECIVPEDVPSIEPYDAVILGSAVYAGRWMGSAREFANRHAEALRQRPVWLFSSGPLGKPLAPAGDPTDVAPLRELLPVREHRTFAGRLVRDQLGLGERAIVGMVRAPFGDFRQWEEITAWARAIARDLAPEAIAV
jgi:menaquinone-dependent protoporphyrinogen oxidase